MPYIGNTAADRFVASKAASVFSGDGSTTAFTLSYGVGSDEDILVSVDGVIQEPSVAYSVSGTTLTFTAAPSSNAGNNIFVYYLFRTVGTVSHPSSNALEATSGTFSSDVTVSGAFTSQGIDDNADATAITIDSSENVGIGETVPLSKLHVKGADSGADVFTDTYLTLENSGDTRMTILSGTSGIGGIKFGDSGLNRQGSIDYVHSDDSMRFATTNSERMRIGSNGHLYATNNDSSLANLTLRNGSSSDSVDFVQCRDSGNNLELKIEGDGDVYNTNNTYGSLSDETLKENISDANSQWNDIKAVQVRNYSMIADELDTANRIGVIAQELETAGMNGLVNQQEDGTKFVKYSILYMKAVKALQEAMTRIETLETAKTDLEARITALENS